MDGAAAVILIIVVFVIIYLIIRVSLLAWNTETKNNRRVVRRVVRRIRCDPTNIAANTTATATTTTNTTSAASIDPATDDRQGNIFTIANETSNNSASHRYNDFFYVEPSAEDAARIRAQLEKDEKDLPTYEEVMAMSAAQAAAGSLTPQHGTSNISIATTDTTVPPYTEVELSGMHSPQLTNTNVTSTNTALQHDGATAWPTANTMTGAGAASTSRAAATASYSTQATVTIANSVTNTSV